MPPGHYLGKFFLYWTLARPHINFLSKSERHSSISLEDIAKKSKIEGSEPPFAVTLGGQNGAVRFPG